MQHEGEGRYELAPSCGKRWENGIDRSKEGPLMVIIVSKERMIETLEIENRHINARDGDQVSICVGEKEF
ncbi:hypothetical protein JW906_01455 [bacterium]|nr:hypothetical protein [bacterium]